MLTPEQLALIPEELAAQMRKLEEDLVADIARRFEKNLSATDTALHQMEVLARAGKDAEEIKNLVLENTKLVEEQYKHLVLEGAALSYHQDIAAYLVGGKVLPGLHDNLPMQRMINAVMRQNWEGLDNLSNTVGFVKNGRYTPLDEFYKSELGKAIFKIHSGAFDYNTVLRGLVKDMADSGVRMIDYDNTTAYHVDVAGRRAVLTTLNQITGQMSMMNAEDMDQDIMETTAHAGARPSHAGWQGELVSLSGKKGYYTLDQIGYGEVTGFMGANCRHGWYPFFEGISKRAYSREYLESIDNPPFTFNDTEYTHYEATQRMRQLERRMRSSKRELIGYDAAGLKDEFTNASIKLRREREHYLEFCNAAGIKPQLERVAAHGYGHSIAGKSSWAIRKNVASQATPSSNLGGIISVKSSSAFYKGVGKAAQTALNHGIATGNECLTWIDLKGKEAFPPLYGSHNQVRFTSQLIDFLNNSQANTLISLHNHPGSSSFSDADMAVTARFPSIKQMRVIGHDGTRYYLRIDTGQRPSPTDIQAAYASERTRIEPKYQKKVQNGMDPHLAWKEHSHEINKAVAKMFGWKYRRIR